jgi:hypothetical protein
MRLFSRTAMSLSQSAGATRHIIQQAAILASPIGVLECLRLAGK